MLLESKLRLHTLPREQCLFAFFYIGIIISVLQPGCLVAAQSPGPSLEEYFKQMGFEAIEFERNPRIQPFVWGVLGNGHKRKFLVDTGCGISRLSESAAHGLKRIGQLNVIFQDSVLGTITNQSVAVMDKLVIEGAQFINQPVRVEQFHADYVTVPFDGVLGYDFLARNFCVIDCWKRRLYVQSRKPSDEQSATLEESLRLSGFTRISLDPAHLLNVQTEINGGSVRLLIDTGAPFDLLDDSELKALGLSILHYERAATGSYIKEDVTSSVIGMGEIGRHRLHAIKAETFQIGTSTWKNIYFGVTDLKDWELSKPGTRGETIKGLLSLAFLGTHGALIDISGNKLWLRPEKSGPR